MRQGIRIAVDVGRARIGVAQSDAQGVLATPVVTLNRQDEDWMNQLRQIITELDPIECVVGLPLSLSGEHTASTQDALEIAEEISTQCSIDCRLVDERFTTTVALNNLQNIGVSQKKSRSFIDQVAAVNILQFALDSERSSGKPPGSLHTDYSG